MDSVQIGKIYKHYKGKLYYVLAIATHSETLEDLVVYLPLYQSDTSQVWVRPLAMFVEDVLYDGVRMQRFTPVLDEKDNV